MFCRKAEKGHIKDEKSLQDMYSAYREICKHAESDFLSLNMCQHFSGTVSTPKQLLTLV